ncbi:MAG: hypothetical protein R3E96_07000 [Planctomycetota bacterium]
METGQAAGVRKVLGILVVGDQDLGRALFCIAVPVIVGIGKVLEEAEGEAHRPRVPGSEPVVVLHAGATQFLTQVPTQHSGALEGGQIVLVGLHLLAEVHEETTGAQGRVPAETLVHHGGLFQADPILGLTHKHSVRPSVRVDPRVHREFERARVQLQTVFAVSVEGREQEVEGAADGRVELVREAVGLTRGSAARHAGVEKPLPWANSGEVHSRARGGGRRSWEGARGRAYAGRRRG